MLKAENSRVFALRVSKKMREINRSLPDGVVEKNGLCSYRSGERHIEKVRNNLLGRGSF